MFNRATITFGIGPHSSWTCSWTGKLYNRWVCSTQRRKVCQLLLCQCLRFRESHVRSWATQVHPVCPEASLNGNNSLSVSILKRIVLSPIAFVTIMETTTQRMISTFCKTLRKFTCMRVRYQLRSRVSSSAGGPNIVVFRISRNRISSYSRLGSMSSG